MPYVENRTIHDADSHVMELPNTITQYMPTKVAKEFAPFVRHREAGWEEEIIQLHDTPRVYGKSR